jgi:SWI/SNF-related matrix-associated actin-dependent regulator of chromatin subfamily A containing DEAD/H box 1
VEEYIFQDMSVMTDFELHKLCLAHRSIKQYALNSDVVMDSGKVQVLKELLVVFSAQRLVDLGST